MPCCLLLWKDATSVHHTTQCHLTQRHTIQPNYGTFTIGHFHIVKTSPPCTALQCNWIMLNEYELFRRVSVQFYWRPTHQVYWVMFIFEVSQNNFYYKSTFWIIWMSFRIGGILAGAEITTSCGENKHSTNHRRSSQHFTFTHCV